MPGDHHSLNLMPVLRAVTRSVGSLLTPFGTLYLWVQTVIPLVWEKQ